MRSPSELQKFYKAYLGDPSDPNYAYRLNAYDLERMAQAHRAMVVGELIADGILYVARLPGRMIRALRKAPAETMRGAEAD
jgi:hypothetical protein